MVMLSQAAYQYHDKVVAPAVPLTAHARLRQQQYGIPDAAIDATLDWGIQMYQTNRRQALFLGDSSTRAARCAGVDIGAWRGLVVILSRFGEVITLIRTSHTRKIRRRLK